MKKTPIIVIILIVLLIICFYEIGIRSFILAPNISEFIPQFKNDGVYIYEDYQEDDFYVKDYFSYKYNIFTKEFMIEKPVDKEYGADNKLEALFSYPKEVTEKYKIYEFKKGKYIIYENYNNKCLNTKCTRRELRSNGVNVESKELLNYKKYMLKTEKKLEGRYNSNYNSMEDNVKVDKDAYIEFSKDGTFKMYKFKSIINGTYEIVKYKYNIHGESVILNFNDKSKESINLEFVERDSIFEDSGIKRGDLIEYEISWNNYDKYKQYGEWIKVK